MISEKLTTTLSRAERYALAERLSDHADSIVSVTAHDLEVDLRAAAKALLQEAEQDPPETDDSPTEEDDRLFEEGRQVNRRALAAGLAIQIPHQNLEEALKIVAELQNAVRYIFGTLETPQG